MQFYYPADYGPHQVGPEPSNGSGGPVRTFKRAVAGAFDFRTTSLPPIPVGAALEIGCATGSFLLQLREKGWDVEGIEASSRAAAAAAARGLRVHAGTVETAPEPGRAFDLVVGWMVVEHLHDPVGGLRKLRSWTRPNGWLALSVPNFGSAEFKVFGNRWYALQVPAHLYHFTPDTIRKTLAAAGWRTERIFHQRVLSNAVLSSAYVADDLGLGFVRRRLEKFPGTSGMGNIALYPMAALLAQVGQTGRMTVWARRTDD